MSFRSKNRSLVTIAGTMVLSLSGSVAWAQQADDGKASSAVGGVCISPKAEEALLACPNTGPTQFNVGERGKTPQANFRSAPPPQDLKKRDAQLSPGAPSETQSAAQRDERASRLQPKVRALLVTEIQGLERLFSSTSKKSPDRVQLARRLAENYVELEAAAFRDKTEAGVRAEEARRKKSADAAKHKQDATNSNKVMLAARKKAIEYYTLITKDYPNYSHLDEVLYYLAYEYEQANDYTNARKVYYELIQNVPQSKYIPNAYLAFGELFFNEAQTDPSKWDLAAASYREVVKYPAPDNKVFGYAHYKLAYVHWNKGELTQALDEFKKTIDYGTQFASLPNAAPLAVSARRDIIPVYAVAGKPEGAFNFFRAISGDAKGETAKTYEMMDLLGQNYLDTGHYREAIVLYNDLMNRDRGDRLCKYQSYVTQATMAMKSSNKDAIRAELDKQVDVYNAFQKGKYADEAKLKCANATAELTSETAMAWHLEAVGSGGERGTNDQKTMASSAYLYKKVVDNFTSEQFAAFEFPRIVKEDWPTILKIKYAMADLLYFQQRWADCGPAFDAVVEEAPDGPDAAEAAYAAVLCYQNIYAQTHQGGSDRKGGGNLPGQQDKGRKGAKADEASQYRAKELTAQQEGMVNAFNRYICYIKPPADDKEGQEQLVEVKYARARTYFEAQRWEEAAVAFRDVAMNHSDRDVGIYAAQLYLESLNVLGSHSEPPKPSCFESMADDVPRFIELYCQGDKFAKNEEQCTTLTKIQCDIQRLKAQKTVELADQGGANSLRLYEQAGNDYIALWRKYGEEPLRNRMAPQCERLDEVVYNGARAFQAGRLVAKSIQARLILINPQNGLDKSPLAKKAIYEIGGNYQAIAVYDEAATWYERYARENPRGENSDKALSDATLLRLGLGQEDEAIRNAELYNKQFGNRFPQQSAAISFGVAAHYVDKEDWDRARQRLQGSIGLIERSATFDVVVQAHAMLGRVYTQLKNEKSAKQSYGKVRSLWSDPKAAEQKVMKIPDEDEGQKLRRLAKALTAVGEALFYFAEEKRAAAETIGFPAYKGPGSRDAVLKHINGPVADWMKKKAPAIETAEQEYLKIVELQPAPPPRWVIAAGSQVGTLWGNFVRDFRAAPIPAAWKTDVEMRNAYYGALDEKSEPIKIRAKGAFETCLKYSVEYQYFDEYSRACEVWLSKAYKNEYHAVDEFRPAPGLVGSGLNDRPYPIQIGGDVYSVSAAQPAAAKTPAASEGESARK